MDLRTRTSLFCAALALAIAISALLRGRPNKAHWLFAAFAADIGLWYLAQWLYHFVRANVWVYFTALLAVLMPQFALHLFEALVPQDRSRSILLRAAGLLAVPILALGLSPLNEHPLVRVVIVVYVFGLFAAGLATMLARGERLHSWPAQKRVRFLVVCGSLAGAFSLADFLWFIGWSLPPVGAVLSVVFLFVVSESLTRRRLVDAYEMLGLGLVSTALAFSFAGIFYLAVVILGRFQNMYLNAVLAGTVILVLFDPLREKVNAYIHKAVFLERGGLEQAVSDARAELAPFLDIAQLGPIVMRALDRSRRFTTAALYLRESTGGELVLAHGFGAQVPPRIDSVALHALLQRLEESPNIQLEELQREIEELRTPADAELIEAHQRVLGAAEHVGPLRLGLCLRVRGNDGALAGLLLVSDERVSHAFSFEDVVVLESLCVQIGVVVDTSRQHFQLQERARLAALGQMAAGLAHEIKNPLGAIKGAAQLLQGSATDTQQREFVDIIVEETERLNRVVGSVLDYARPAEARLAIVDVNHVVDRTVQLLASDHATTSIRTVFGTQLGRVRADAEKLRQVLINLIRNAVQAMNGGGEVTVATTARAASPLSAGLVEISVSDHGPGVSAQAADHLFVPFFTTKRDGTGLGLAISQRVVREMGGQIEFSSEPGRGATFRVLLPVVSTEP